MQEFMTPNLGSGLFFGVGTGRCGTMFLANLLNSHPSVVCLHQGLFRQGTEMGERVLPSMILQNNAAYQSPGEATRILQDSRGDLAAISARFSSDQFGDIAYSYAPFVTSIATLYPESRIIFVYRSGIEFIRSVVTNQVPDPCPVGWLDRAPSTADEHFVTLGRLRPRISDSIYLHWKQASQIGRNAWLWAETNRLILSGLTHFPPSQVLAIRFESFFADIRHGCNGVCEFLNLPPLPEASLSGLLRSTINGRHRKTLPGWKEWTAQQKAEFTYFGSEMMRTLQYELDS